MTITLNDNSQDANNYYWSSPNGGVISDPNEASPSISFDTPGAYDDIQLIIKDINNCRDTFVLPETVFVNEITADIIADPIAGCEPLTVNFSDNSNNLYNTNNTWAWDFGDGTGSSTLATPSYTYTSAGDYAATLTVTDSWGCTDEIVMATPINVSAPIAFFEATETEGCTVSTLFQELTR